MRKQPRITRHKPIQQRSTPGGGIVPWIVFAGFLALCIYSLQNQPTMDSILDEAKKPEFSWLDAPEEKPEEIPEAKEGIEALYSPKLDDLAMLFANNYCHYYPGSKSCK